MGRDSKNLSPWQVMLTIALFGALLIAVAAPAMSESRNNGRSASSFAGIATIACVIGLVLARRRRQAEQARIASAKRAAADRKTLAVPRPVLYVNPEHPIIMPRHAPKSPQPDESPQRLIPIDLVRELLGTVPREFDSALRDYLHAEPPAWLAARPTDEMMGAFRNQGRLRRDGKVVWAVVVQANNLIWRPGPSSHGASVIWSEDPYYDERTNELSEMARDLFALKGQDQADPESAAFSRMLTNEMIRADRLPVPSRFTGGRKVFHSSLMLTRQHLPSGYLARGMMPIWIDPQPTGHVLLVPAAYWPPSLTAFWKGMEKPVKA